MSFKVDNPKFAPVGVADTYNDAYGKTHLVYVAVKKQLLTMMAKSGCENAPLPSVRVFRQGKAALIPLSGDGEFGWMLMYENGG